MITINALPAGRVITPQVAKMYELDVDTAQVVLDQLVANGDITAPVVHTLLNGPGFDYDVDTYLESELSSEITNNGPNLAWERPLITMHGELPGTLTPGPAWTDGRITLFSGHIIAVGISLGIGPSLLAGEIDITVNSVVQHTLSIPVGVTELSQQLSTPVSVSEGDVVNFVTQTGSAMTDASLSLIIRKN